jgi:phosphodiesterase/alkaline phosphatase D-like protein
MGKLYRNANVKILYIRSILRLTSALFFCLLASLMFNTCIEDPEIMPKFNILQVADTDITSTSAILRGEIQILGNRKIIEYGVEYSKNRIFSPLLRKGFTTTPVLGVYQVEVTGLDPGTLYYYRAYVLINTAYLNSQLSLNFTTK